MNRNRLFWFGLFLSALLVAFVPSSWGQATTSLRGAVADPSGAAIPNATINLVNVDTNASRTATTDAQGNYVFLQVPPGSYKLDVQASGFANFEQKGIALVVNLPATINVRMKIGATTQTVTVTEQAPLLNTTDASQGNTMTGTAIQNLPLEGGNVVQLLSLQPGVVYTSDRSDIDTGTDTRSGAVNGERSDQSNVTLDGIDVNDQGGGQAFTSVLPITVDSVQEFRVTTSNYGADQGRSAGAEVALVTRGGTNKFHGSLYELNRSSLGEANDFFIKSAEASQGQPNVAPQLVRNVFGGSIGGPVKHDRLFFFLNYEGHRIAQASSAVREIPTAALRDGVIQYKCDDPTACPGGSVVGLSGASYTVTPGHFALNATQIKGMDPLGIGPSQTVLNYFNTYPLPNDATVGDGFNFSGFRFAASQPERNDILIGRVDYQLTANGNQHLFWRGSGQDSVQDGAPFLPGRIPETVTANLSKGFVAGYSAVIHPTLVNNLRYGFTRQSVGISGNSDQPFIFIRRLSQGVTRSQSFQFPVHNLTDDLAWTHGNHSFTFGTNVRIVYNNSSNTGNSFTSGTANAAWLNTGGFANRVSPFNPSCTTDNGAAKCGTANDVFPTVASGFNNSYDFPLIGMLGMVTEVDAQYNFNVFPTGTGIPLAQGAPVVRNYALYEYEFYAQDSWKIRPNLTFNYGLRYGIDTPPWERHGQEVAPTFDLGSWFTQRSIDMQQNGPSNLDPAITFALAGRANHRTDLWATQKKNFAPRVSIAWSPNANADWLKRIIGDGQQTVIRAGFGMYYDHFGEGMLSTFDQNGSFGLSSTLTNPAQTENAASSPRLTGMNTIPVTDNNGDTIFTPAPPAQFPQTFPVGNFCICWGLDSSVQSPYSYALDLSVQRQLPHNMSVEFAYTGHLGHRLMTQEDLAMPKDLKDPKSGITYFQAAQAISTIARGGADPSTVTAASVGPTAAYWQDMMQPLAAGDMYNPGDTTFGPGCGGPTTDVVQAVYAAYLCNADNETTGLFFLDVNGIPGSQTTTDSNGDVSPTNFYFSNSGPFAWFNPQYSSLYAWRSQSTSSYHALQVTFQKQMTNGLAFDVNYTYSHSIDLASDAERVGEWGGLGGEVINSWSPNQLRGSSDFDLRHQINAHWNWQIPVGRSRHFANDIGKGLDAIIGGWQISGLSRWSSGFPVNVGTCFCFETNWQLSGEAIATAKVKTSRTLFDNGPGVGKLYNIFPNGPDAVNSFDVALPGFSGARNQIRGDGYLDTDIELGKIWKMPFNENHELRFTWDTFNVFNLKRFDVQTSSLELDNANTFGNYTHLLTNPRVMQFGLRYQF